MPMISVIVPVYKVEKYIHRCIDSILAQTFTNFELILVDDGSPDNCGAICDEYAAKDARIHVIHQENGGLSAARNAGIDWAFANSDSQWLTFIDSDDWVHLQYLQRLLVAAEDRGVDLSVCGYAETQGEEPIIEDQDLVVAVWNPEDFYVQHNVNAIVAWGKLYRKECFAGIRYPVGRLHEDEFTTHKLLFACDKIAVIPEPLYAYYQNPEGITKSQWNPRRVDGAYGLNAQRLFFRERGFEKAHTMAAAACASHLCKVIDRLRQLPGSKKHLRKVRRLLRCVLRQERGMFPFRKEHWWKYEQAYPRAMYLYWTWVGICGKIKRGMKKCRK